MQNARTRGDRDTMWLTAHGVQKEDSYQGWFCTVEEICIGGMPSGVPFTTEPIIRAFRRCCD